MCLKELLELHRQRLEQSKQHFLLSTPPTPTSCGSISLCVSPTPSLTVGTSSSLHGGEQEPDQEEQQEQEEDDDEDEEFQCNTATELDSGMQLTTTVSSIAPLGGPLQKSPSANSSLHFLYTSLFRKLADGKRGGRTQRRRRHASQSEQEEYDVDVDGDDVDGGVCDISGGELSDDYDHCDVSLSRKRCTRHRVARDVSETDYHGDVELETAPTRESCYETSDTGGELTNTDDLDSSMNLISNLSYNSSNSNTSNTSTGHQRRQAGKSAAAPGQTSSTATGTTAKGTIAPTGHAGQALSVLAGRNPKTAALPKAKPKPKSILSAPKHTKGGSVSSPNSSDCSSASPACGNVPVSPVGRSKSFQEPGVARYKKYGRGIFQRRRSKRSPKGGATGGTKSNYSLDRLSQNIEITIQDEDGVILPYDDNFHTLPSLQRLALDATDADAYDDVEYEDLYLDDRPHRLSGDDIGGDISDGGASSRSRASDADGSGHVFGRLLRRVRGLSAGWRKPRYQKRRGD